MEISVEEKMLEEISKAIEQIECSASYLYPCDKKPSIYIKEKTLHVITGACKIELSHKQSGEKKTYEPKVYQSCMNPSQIEIKTLQISMLENKYLMIKTDYETSQIDITDLEIDIQPWKARIYKSSCNPCANCGRCSW